LPPGPRDPELFQDRAGRTYRYWDASNIYPLYGAEIDLPLDDAAAGEGRRMAFLAKPQPRLHADPDQHAREHVGRDHTDSRIASCVEGGWMNRHPGRCDLQYAAPGTEYNVYATGVYVGDGPPGPFRSIQLATTPADSPPMPATARPCAMPTATTGTPAPRGSD